MAEERDAVLRGVAGGEDQMTAVGIPHRPEPLQGIGRHPRERATREIGQPLLSVQHSGPLTRIGGPEHDAIPLRRQSRAHVTGHAPLPRKGDGFHLAVAAHPGQLLFPNVCAAPARVDERPVHGNGEVRKLVVEPGSEDVSRDPDRGPRESAAGVVEAGGEEPAVLSVHQKPRMEITGRAGPFDESVPRTIRQREDGDLQRLVRGARGREQDRVAIGQERGIHQVGFGRSVWR